MMLRALVWSSILIGCGSSKSPTSPSNSHPGSAEKPVAAASSDCGDGTLLTTENPSADCPFAAEVMGPPKATGDITMLKCCYKTAKAACSAGGCEVKDCTVGDKPGTPVICKDTTHGGVPTNP